MAAEAVFRPGEILLVLAEHEVDFVIVGGFAAVLHGAAHITTDVDITPKRGRANLARLSAALVDLGARIRVEGVPEGLVFGHDAESLARAAVWNLQTEHGDLDISFVPSGTEGWDDLRGSAVTISLRDRATLVASLADVIRSKEAADREKDRIVLPTLRRLLAETEGEAP